jgi:hypothetical protein
MEKTTQILLVVFIAVSAVSLLAQALFTMGMFIGARKAQKKITGLADDIRLHGLPAIIAARDVIQDLTPKIRTIADNLAATSVTLRAKSDQLSGLVGDVSDRAQAQATRVDGMVKTTLDQIIFAAQALEHGVAIPIRQANGILNGLRAGVDVLRKKSPADHVTPEDDLFV